jgi:hypothetical protein
MPWFPELVTTWTLDSPRLQPRVPFTKRMLPLSGFVFLMQRLIVPNDRFFERLFVTRARAATADARS